MSEPSAQRQDPNRFEGRVALVTGAARGIGAAIAETLAERGATVASADVLPTGEWTLKLDAPHTRHTLDVRSGDSARAVVEEVLAAHGRIDHLVNGAGIVRRGSALDTTEDDIADVLDVNLVGTFRVTRAAHDALAATRGSVVNIGSTNGHIAVLNTLGYCVSKAGVMHMARVLALEWAPEGIRVNAVGPTIVPTDMTADLRTDPAYMADKLATIPLGRMAEADDVADTVTYLLSPAARMITGQTIFVDGGVTIH
ncbi:D-threitol dehydrogenase [Pseudonocardia ailaonensis]|uniref:D-threitol dehydrogenase n=1 Tax=Pseudonocardia ailaonensis TaxID=367279 RepID=A0ABN2NF75_9PSEU